MMQSGPKRLVGWVAIVVIAMQSLLLGFANHAPAAAGFDPATVICHSDGSSEAADTQTPPGTPDDCCAQCILVSNFSAAGAPAVAIHLPQPRASGATLTGQSLFAAAAATAATSHRPRAPPVAA
jgi:hypothetical protein